MASTVLNRNQNNVHARSSGALRILLMCGDHADLENCNELLRAPEYRIQTCSNYVELMLHLQREAFQLVIMFEGEKALPEWQGVVKQAAEASGGTPVLVFKRPEEMSSVKSWQPRVEKRTDQPLQEESCYR